MTSPVPTRLRIFLLMFLMSLSLVILKCSAEQKPGVEPINKLENAKR
jgi:hypothetical protein